MATKYLTDSTIENLLRSFNGLKLKVDAKKEQLYSMFPPCISQVGDGTSRPVGLVSNSTANYAIKNATVRDYLISSIEDSIKYVRLIEGLYGAMSSDSRCFMKEYYFNRNKKEEVMAALFISDKTFERSRRKVLDEINDMLTDNSIDVAV